MNWGAKERKAFEEQKRLLQRATLQNLVFQNILADYTPTLSKLVSKISSDYKLNTEDVKNAFFDSSTSYQMSDSQVYYAVLEELSENRLVLNELYLRTVFRVLLLIALLQRFRLKSPVTVFRGLTDTRLARVDLTTEDLQDEYDQDKLQFMFRRFIRPNVEVQSLAFGLRRYVRPFKFKYVRLKQVEVAVTDEKEKSIIRQEVRDAIVEEFLADPKLVDKVIQLYSNLNLRQQDLLESKLRSTTIMRNQLNTSEVGEVITNVPFVSTSLTELISRGFARGKSGKEKGLLLQISLPAGTPTIPLTYGKESELLLPPCSDFLVLSRPHEDASGIRTVRLKYLGSRTMPNGTISNQEIAWLIQLGMKYPQLETMPQKDLDTLRKMILRQKCVFTRFATPTVTFAFPPKIFTQFPPIVGGLVGGYYSPHNFRSKARGPLQRCQKAP